MIFGGIPSSIWVDQTVFWSSLGPLERQLLPSKKTATLNVVEPKMGKTEDPRLKRDDLTKHHLRVPVGYHHSIIKVMFKNTQEGHDTTPV